MTVILIRAVIFFVFLNVIMRVMGKRQMGEIQLSEFVTALMISELASLPITDREIPLLHGIVAVTAIASLEVITSFLCGRLPRFRKLLEGEPVVLAADGRFIVSGMDKARVTVDEVLSAVRSNGFKSIADVCYVVLEQNGSISVIPKASKDSATPSDLNITVSETGMDMPVMINGVKIKEFMTLTGKTDGDIEHVLRRNGCSAADCLVLSFDGNGKAKLIRKSGTEASGTQ